MKHLKLFENQSETVWVAIYMPTHNTNTYIRNNTEVYVFETEEDLKNFILDYINSDLSTWQDPPNLDGYKYETDEDEYDFFIDFHDAMAWLNNSNAEYRFLIFEKYITKNVKVPENVRFYRDTNKYNL